MANPLEGKRCSLVVPEKLLRDCEARNGQLLACKMRCIGLDHLMEANRVLSTCCMSYPIMLKALSFRFELGI